MLKDQGLFDETPTLVEHRPWPLEHKSPAMDIQLLSFRHTGHYNRHNQAWHQQESHCICWIVKVVTKAHTKSCNRETPGLPGLFWTTSVGHLPVVRTDPLHNFGTRICRSRLAAHIIFVVSERYAFGSSPRAQKLLVALFTFCLGGGFTKRVLQNDLKRISTGNGCVMKLLQTLQQMASTTLPKQLYWGSFGSSTLLSKSTKSLNNSRFFDCLCFNLPCKGQQTLGESKWQQ